MLQHRADPFRRHIDMRWYFVWRGNRFQLELIHMFICNFHHNAYVYNAQKDCTEYGEDWVIPDVSKFQIDSADQKKCSRAPKLSSCTLISFKIFFGLLLALFKFAIMAGRLFGMCSFMIPFGPQKVTDLPIRKFLIYILGPFQDVPRMDDVELQMNCIHLSSHFLSFRFTKVENSQKIKESRLVNRTARNKSQYCYQNEYMISFFYKQCIDYLSKSKLCKNIFAHNFFKLI